MARRLAANKFAAAAEFSRLIYPPDKPVSPWEGRLFPDTYLLPQDGAARQLLNPLHDRFKKVAEVLPKPFPIGENGRRLSLAQVVTLASLVERETNVADERPIVAG